jgi:hypothetical protein
MTAFDSSSLKKQLEDQLKQIDAEEIRLRELIADKARILRVIKALDEPVGAPGELQTSARQREYHWTKEVKKYFEEGDEGLYTPAEVVDGICRSLKIEKPENITRNIRSVLDKLKALSIIGSVKDLESGKPLFGAFRYFVDNTTLKSEYQHLLG